VRRNLPSFVGGALVAAAALSAQSTLTVGPGGFPTVQAAVDAAFPGDEVVIEPGSYGSFVLMKGLTIRAAVPGTVSVAGAGFFSLVLAPANAPVRLQGLNMGSYTLLGGRISVEDCDFVSAGIVLSVGNVVAHFERCRVIGQPFLVGAQAAMVCNGSTVSMVDCSVVPTPGGVGSSGTPGVNLNGATLVATGCTFEGAAVPPSPALDLDQTSTAWLSDCTVLTPNNSCGIVGGSVTTSRSTLPPSCSVPSQPLLGVTANGSVVRGQDYDVTFQGEPNTFVLVFGSNELDRTLSPFLQQPFLLASAGCFPAAAMVTDQTGRAGLSIPVPNANLPAGIGVYLQGVSGVSLPLLASAAVGGVVL